MSCFCGQMKVYQNVSIDRFDGENLNAVAFFLSHCHTDHMIGLASPFLEERLRANHAVKLYTSEVTKLLLLEDTRYAFLKPHIYVLPIEEPKLLPVGNTDITVTLLPAGHCPGSVMFLFEGNEGTSLYTGDFRLPKGSAARMTCLHSGNKRLKKIDHVYVDTTFCIPDAYYIPKREQCLDALISLVEGWICKGPDHIVRMNVSAKYGYEYLFEALFQRFSQKLYSARADVYRCLPNIAKVLTNNPTHCQIYVCFKTERVKEKDWSQWKAEADESPTDARKLHFLYVKLSTLYFTHAAAPEDVKICVGKNRYRLCFSFHSSLSEVCDFLRYLKPGAIHANVIPRQGESFQSVENRLNELCFGNEAPSVVPDTTSFKPFGKLNRMPDVSLPNRCFPASESCSKEVDRRRPRFFAQNSDSDEEIEFVSRKRKK